MGRRVTPEAFGSRLKRLIAAKGWSQSDFARQVWGSDKQRERVSAYVNGKQFPGVKNLNLIAKVLGVTVGELVLPQPPPPGPVYSWSFESVRMAKPRPRKPRAYQILLPVRERMKKAEN